MSAPASPIVERFRGMWRSLASTIGVFVVASLGATILYRAWGTVGVMPLDSREDVWVHLTYIRNLQHGSLNHTNLLGAPFGQYLLDFPTGNDLGHIVLWKVVACFTNNPITVLNVSYLLGYGLVAAAAELVARALGIERSKAILLAFAFAFLPYHFGQGAQHPFLAGYWAVPLAVLVALWTIAGTLPVPWVTARGASWWSEHRRRFAILVACIVVGSASGSYYTLISLFLIASAAVAGQFRRRSNRDLAAAGVVLASSTAVFVVTLIPAFLWNRSHGRNIAVTLRPISDVENWSLHLSHLLLPGPESRLSPLARLGSQIADVSFPGERGTYAGMLAIAGLGFALVSLLRHGVQSRGPRRQLLHDAGLLALIVVLWATIGGLSGIVAGFGFTQIRVWSRATPYISMLGLLALALVPTGRLRSLRLSGRSRQMLLGVILLLVVLIDQVPTDVPQDMSQTRLLLRSNQQLVEQLHSAFPDDAMIFQLPVVSFPEGTNVNYLVSYLLLVPYLVDHGSLRWSFGGIRGRAGDWQLNWAQEEPRTFAIGLALAGFDAVTIERTGFIDRGAAFQKAVEPILGRPHRVDQNLEWYDLRPLQARLDRSSTKAQLTHTRKLLLNAAVPEIRNFEPPLVPMQPDVAQWFEKRSTVVIHNPLDGPRPVRLELELSARLPSTLSIEGPGLHRTLRLGPEPRRFSLPVTLQRGESEFRITSNAPIDFNAPILRRRRVYSAAVRADHLLVVDPNVIEQIEAAAD